MRYIPLDRVGELVSALAELTAHGPLTRRRDAIGVLLGLHGLRVGEVSRAMAADFSPASRSIDVRTLKGGKPRTVPLLPATVEAIVGWRRAMELHDARGPLLPTRQGRSVAPTQFRRFAKRLTLRLYGEAFKFHALRHTSAMIVLADPANHRDVMLVKKHLGHRSLESTAQYVEALDQLSPSSLPNLACPHLPHMSGAQLRLWRPEESAG